LLKRQRGVTSSSLTEALLAGCDLREINFGHITALAS
jgi:hypothetical protein